MLGHNWSFSRKGCTKDEFYRKDFCNLENGMLRRWDCFSLLVWGCISEELRRESRNHLRSIQLQHPQRQTSMRFDIVIWWLFPLKISHDFLLFFWQLFQGTFSLSIFSAKHILKLGTSADMGICQGKGKDGACTAIIDKYARLFLIFASLL